MTVYTSPGKIPADTPAGRPPAGRDDQCRRCGICCRKGGPALHREDAPLVERGAIPIRHLFTLRKGEMVVDNVHGGTMPLAGEIIKIKGRDGAWTCCFYDSAAQACGIYDARPVECRVLTCRDTAAIERMYARDRLTRRDLLSAVSGLWDLVQAHETNCAIRKIEALVAQLQGATAAAARAALGEIMAYDRHLRALTVEKSGMAADQLDFLFGRPLADTIGRHFPDGWR